MLRNFEHALPKAVKREISNLIKLSEFQRHGNGHDYFSTGFCMTDMVASGPVFSEGRVEENMKYKTAQVAAMFLMISFNGNRQPPPGSAAVWLLVCDLYLGWLVGDIQVRGGGRLIIA